MFYQEHGVPHFHAEHQGQQASFLFSGEILAGEIRSPVARRLIAEWAACTVVIWRQIGAE